MHHFGMYRISQIGQTETDGTANECNVKLMTHSPEIGAEFRRFFVLDAIWYAKNGAESQHERRKN